MDFKELIKQPEYDFLRENPHLGANIILLGFGGSHAYGTNIEGSDVDIRGIALNSRQDILTMHDFEQVTNEQTDTTVYSLHKMFNLLVNCNPNTIELLGLQPEQYLVCTEAGKMLLDNKDLFLTKKAINSFGGYANMQLYRLNQKAAHSMHQDELEKHILKTMHFMQESFAGRYATMPNDSIKLYIDKAVQPNMETEIFIDGQMNHVSLRDFSGMLGEFNNTMKQYGKIGKRNEKAYEHNKIAKHMMHLVRLYLMVFDILEKGEINTKRDNDHDFLMSIRNGAYLNENNQPVPEFFELVDTYEKRLEEDAEETSLPAEPDMDKVNELMCSINEKVFDKSFMEKQERETFDIFEEEQEREEI